MEAEGNMRRCITDGLNWEMEVIIHRVLNLVNSFVEMFLRTGEFIRHQEVLKVRLASSGSW